MNGFLGTGASLSADLNLVIQVAMALLLLVGMVLARRKKFRAHKYCQSFVMLLNLPLIAFIMAPSFHRQVEPQIPAGLGDSYYLVAALHAALGILAQMLGLYIILAAGTNILPARLRFKRYKPWMRTELVLWWAVVLIGLATYYVWHVAPSSKPQPQAAATATQSADAPEMVTITITNFRFEPDRLTIPEGTTVEWVDSTGRHTVEADDGSFKSAVMGAGDRFRFKFEQAGEFPYFCGYHGDKGGVDMAGVIIVTPRPR